MVKDDSIEENELFAVYYYVRKDDSETASRALHGNRADYRITSMSWTFSMTTKYHRLTTEPAVPHYLGEIPIIEYLNNKLAIGDFELQIPLIDAYNVLMSDRVTDKEQFIDAILAIYGTLLADEEIEDENGEKKDGDMKAMKQLKKRQGPGNAGRSKGRVLDQDI